MAEPEGNGMSEEEFSKFFNTWLTEQNQYLHQLVSHAEHYESGRLQQLQDQELVLTHLVQSVVGHYKHYYETKSMCVNHDPMAILYPSWGSSIEDEFAWMGGWHPSAAFKLLYSKMWVLSTRNLRNLSANQVVKFDELKDRTLKEVNKIVEKMLKHQGEVADPNMTELSHRVAELKVRDTGVVAYNSPLVAPFLQRKEERLKKVLRRADDLRLRTLIAVIELLNPIQKVHFLIAAGELHQTVHKWGKQKDDATTAPNEADSNNHDDGGDEDDGDDDGDDGGGGDGGDDGGGGDAVEWIDDDDDNNDDDAGERLT